MAALARQWRSRRSALARRVWEGWPTSAVADVALHSIPVRLQLQHEMELSVPLCAARGYVGWPHALRSLGARGGVLLVVARTSLSTEWLAPLFRGSSCVCCRYSHCRTCTHA